MNKGIAIVFALLSAAAVWLIAGFGWLVSRNESCDFDDKNGHLVDRTCNMHSTGYLFWGFVLGVAWVTLAWVIENKAWRARLVIKKDGRSFEIVARTWFASDTLLSQHNASALDEDKFHEAVAEAKNKVALYNVSQR